MKSNANNTTNIKNWKPLARIAALTLGALAFIATQLETRSVAFAGDPQTIFESPAAAGAALLQGAKNNDDAGLDRILGVTTKTLLGTGDPRADKAALDAFAAKYEKMNRWVDMTDGTRVLYIGADNFAFPVPLAKNTSGQWYFDGVAGAEEIRARDIGRNELLAIDACAALADAQGIYFANGGDSGQYAQRIISSTGTQDGLYWPATGQAVESPLTRLAEFPKSSLTSLAPDQPFIIDGYSIRILTAQGDSAIGGASDYVLDGKMTGGFAVLATPATYGETGIATFMMGPDGAIYERDLGPDTTKIAASIQAFNPTRDWSQVE